MSKEPELKELEPKPGDHPGWPVSSAMPPRPPRQSSSTTLLFGLVLIFICIGAVAFVIGLSGPTSSGVCQDAVPNEDTGRCSDVRHRVYVEDGVAVCRCSEER